MKIVEIKDSEVWSNYVSKLNLKTFLHSQAWVEFNKICKQKNWQLGIYGSDNKLKSVCLIIKVEAKRGKFLLVPHGPQTKNNQKYYLEIWKKHLENLAKKEKCSFVRIQPILSQSIENQKIFTDLGFKSAPIHVHTELTSVLDISREIKEILMSMRKTTRQMIKKAEKMLDSKEIEIIEPLEITPEMYEVYKDTYKRGGAVPYSKNSLQAEWKSFCNSGAKILAIKYQDNIISWGMVLIHSNRAFYHQGANILIKKIPASYLIHWKLIEYAKSLGCISYDFWGVSPETEPNHPWANISLFKRGFGGQDLQHLHAQDLVINFFTYLPTWLIDKYRAKKRGF